MLYHSTPRFVQRLPKILSAEYLAEARDLASLPPVGPPEIAIAGRSNVGKSTLLNRLVGRRALARTSKTPGRTRGVILYELTLGEPEAMVLRFADLPGYGYAQVSRDERRSWQHLVEGYTRSRPTVALFVVLVDARRGPQDEERQLIDWLEVSRVRTVVVVTKVDKLRAAERSALTRRQPTALLASGTTGEGVDEIWANIRAAIAALGSPA